MIVLNERVKLIAKTAQGSVYISYRGLRDHIIAAVKQFMKNKKIPYTLKDVEFVKFEDEINFQVHVFFDVSKSSKISDKINHQIQKAILTFVGTEYQIEVLSVNIICSVKSK